MRKSLAQIIGEATEKLPEQGLIIGDEWSVGIGDGIGRIVVVTFVKHYGGWALSTTNY